MNGNEYMDINYYDYGYVFCGLFKYFKLFSMFDKNDEIKHYKITYDVADMLLNSNLNQNEFMEIVKRENIKGYIDDRDTILFVPKIKVNNIELSKAVDLYLNRDKRADGIQYIKNGYAIIISEH